MIHGPHEDLDTPPRAHVGPVPAWVWVPLGISILTVLSIVLGIWRP